MNGTESDMDQRQVVSPVDTPQPTLAVRLETIRLFPPGLGRQDLLDILQSLLEVFGCGADGLFLRVVDDEAQARLNAAQLGCTGPTNILSFPSGEQAGTEEGAHLGEMVLSADTLERECLLYGQPPEEHLVRLLAHACLHLMGHDHGPLMDELTETAVDALHPANEV